MGSLRFGQRGRVRRRAALATLPVAALLASAFTGLPSVPGTASAGSIPPPRPCPPAYPVSSLHQGMSATGYTVDHGTTPKPFAVKVLGVSPNGIAPGIDLILVKASSPAIDAAGGIWAGMSGSPVYAPDGRLIGAISYALSFAPSHTAGVTPASAMYELLTMPGSATFPMRTHVALSDPLARRVTDAKAASATDAASGLDMLRTPFSVSGLGAHRLSLVRRMLDKAGAPPTVVYAGSSATGGVAKASAVRPGGNFVAAASTGDVTDAAIGTTTAVCGSRVLAFGHPALGAGVTNMAARLATALYVQRDALGGPYKVANVTGLVGRVGQDRLVGVRGWLAHPPRVAVVESDVSASTGLSRHGRTYVPYQGFVQPIAMSHIISNLDATLQKYGSGRSWVSFTIYGTLPDRTAWHVSRTTRVADQYDISYATGNVLYTAMDQILTNPITTVRIGYVRIHARAYDTFLQYSLGDVYAKTTGGYARLTSRTPLTVHPGDTVTLRTTLMPFKSAGTPRYAYVTVTVPATAVAGSGTLDVYGGLSAPTPGSQPTSFDQVLRRIHRQPRNDAVVAHLYVPGSSRQLSRQARTVAPRVVTGRSSFPVEVTTG